MCDVRWAPKLWAQDGGEWEEQKTVTPEPLLASYDQSIGFDGAVHWQKCQITCSTGKKKPFPPTLPTDLSYSFL